MKKLSMLAIVATVIATSINAQCKCATTPAESRWDGIGFYVGDKPLNKYKCGYQFSVKKTDKIKFVSGSYNCIATGACDVIYTALLYRGSSIVKRINPFNFTTEIISFTTGAGSYRLVLEATCNNKKCQQCVYYFTVN